MVLGTGSGQRPPRPCRRAAASAFEASLPHPVVLGLVGRRMGGGGGLWWSHSGFLGESAKPEPSDSPDEE